MKKGITIIYVQSTEMEERSARSYTKICRLVTREGLRYGVKMNHVITLESCEVRFFICIIPPIHFFGLNYSIKNFNVNIP